ncbi:MAG: M3 family metallopeptidase [Bacteroidales bacterium]|nr:M3 family metallopeptidase [Bacteroidales bacterium]
MKIKHLITAIIPLLLLISCNMNDTKKDQIKNPFFEVYDTPYDVPPFDRIKNEHFLPAIKEGIRQQQEKIAAIVNNQDAATFENTVEALENSGELLTKVNNVFNNLRSANTNDELQSKAKEAAPLISKNKDDINLNAQLFDRIKRVFEEKEKFNLTTEEGKLLEEKYVNFIRGGANLPPADQKRFREINEELSVLSLTFGDNLLAETNEYKLVIENREELSGLSESVIEAAAELAREAELNGKWVFTLANPSRLPFLQYADNRNLREKIFIGYINKGNHDDEKDNKEILMKVASLRIERANLLGYTSHAAYVLDKNMAKKPENVYKLLGQLWTASLPVAQKEAEELQKIIDSEGGDFTLEAWDWWYYAEKLKKEKYDLDEEQLRPYFQLNKVLEGLFGVANQLYGLQIEEIFDIQKPHEDAHAYVVKENDGTLTGILYIDFFPRSSKRFGAWMSSYRKEYFDNGKRVVPVITLNCNFTKPSGDKPSLLSFDEYLTLFHEFGHGLHGLLSQCTYMSLSGTSTPRDFVELPSQIMENWAAEPEVLKTFAVHYETGEIIPQSLLDKLNKSKHFNQGFTTVEYLAACYLDMDWHTLTEPLSMDVLSFENSSMNKIGLIPEIVVRYRSTYFQHIFSGGYSSGYYSYIWAEVLDADAFAAFKENGIFDQATARSFRENILEKGGTEDPMVLYTNFRGKEPDVKHLLKRKGLK